MRTIGVPQVLITSPENPIGFRALSHAEIDRALETATNSIEIAAALHADFAFHQALWNAEAVRLGFDEIRRQEAEAWSQEGPGERCDLPRTSLKSGRHRNQDRAGRRTLLNRPGRSKNPWPQLRSTLADVRRLRRTSGAPVLNSRWCLPPRAWPGRAGVKAAKSLSIMTRQPRPRKSLDSPQIDQTKWHAFRAQARPFAGLRPDRYINGLIPMMSGVIVGRVFILSDLMSERLLAHLPRA